MDSPEKIIALIAELRDLFPFPPDKDYDSGYSFGKSDGWHMASIVCGPVSCLEAMISVLKGHSYHLAESPLKWLRYDHEDPGTWPERGKYLISRKDGKVHWDTWNESGWAYSYKVIRYYAVITLPEK